MHPVRCLDSACKGVRKERVVVLMCLTCGGCRYGVGHSGLRMSTFSGVEVGSLLTW